MCGIFSGFSSIFGRIPFIENTCPVRRKAAGHILLYSPIGCSGHGRRTSGVATLLKRREGRITFAGFSCLPSRFGGRVDTLRTQRRAGEMPDRSRAGRKGRERHSPTGPSGRGRRTSRNRATGRFPGGGGPPRR